MNTQVLSRDRSAARLGYWSSIVSVVLMALYIVLFVALLFVQPLFLWTNMTDYIAFVQAHPPTLADFARLTMLLFGPLLVIILGALHEHASAEDKFFTRLALAFGLGFAVLSGTHYFVQLTAVRFVVAQGNLQGMEQFIQANPHSVFSSINMLGWTLFLGLASLFAAQAVHGGGVAGVVRISLLANGVICLLGGVAFVLDIVVLVFLTVNLGMGGALTVALVGLALYFRKAMAAA